ncbi:hypothetical protein ACA910_018226 [Epithemia clementina (nom. ined.)]
MSFLSGASAAAGKGGGDSLPTRMVENETLNDAMGNKGLYNGPVLINLTPPAGRGKSQTSLPSDDPDAPPPVWTDVSLEDDKPPIPHGNYGQMVYIDHESFVKFTGDWSHGKWTKGTLLYANGDVYSGPWNEKGQPHGPNGKLEWVVVSSSPSKAAAGGGGGGDEDTRTYQGDWKNGLRHGQGTYTWSRTGAIYQGAFESNQRQGYGTYRDPTTQIEYVGEWKQGVYHGYGQYTWVDYSSSSNGNSRAEKFVYRGNFVQGKPHGHGIQVNDKGVVMHDGAWDHGKPVIVQDKSTEDQAPSPARPQPKSQQIHTPPRQTSPRSAAAKPAPPPPPQQQQTQPPPQQTQPHAQRILAPGMQTLRAPPVATPPPQPAGRIAQRTVTHIPAPGAPGYVTTKKTVLNSPPPAPRSGNSVAGPSTPSTNASSRNSNNNSNSANSPGAVTVVHDREWMDTFNQAQPALGIYRGLWLHQNPYQNGTVVYQQGEVESYEGWFNPQGYYHGQGCRLTFRNGDTYEGDFQYGQRHGKGLYTWKDGRQYKGAFYKNARQGKGTLIYPNSDFYEGQFIQGKRHGHGRFIFASGSMYEGTWQGGLYHGHGTLVQSDGSTYVGEFAQGLKHGTGKDLNQNGEVVYEGLYHRGKPKTGNESPDNADGKSIASTSSSQSSYTTPNNKRQSSQQQQQQQYGSSVESYWVEDVGDSASAAAAAPSPQPMEPPCHAVVDQEITDCQGNLGRFTGIVLNSTLRPHGVGRLVYADGKRIHEGFWRNGSKEGHGRCLFFPQGDFHEGEYQNNLRNGPGRYQWKDGRLFMGHYKDDMRHGKGIFAYPSGDRYEGMFFKGQRSGYGKFIFSGGHYEGEWKAGKYHGRGRLVWGPGTEYEGEFSQGTFHGSGTLRDFTGNILEQGRWFQGKRVAFTATAPTTTTTTTTSKAASTPPSTPPRAPPPVSAPPPIPKSETSAPVPASPQREVPPLPARQQEQATEGEQSRQRKTEQEQTLDGPTPQERDEVPRLQEEDQMPSPDGQTAAVNKSKTTTENTSTDVQDQEAEATATTTLLDAVDSTEEVNLSPPSPVEQNDNDNAWTGHEPSTNKSRISKNAEQHEQVGGEDPVENGDTCNNGNSNINNNNGNRDEEYTHNSKVADHGNRNITNNNDTDEPGDEQTFPRSAVEL